MLVTAFLILGTLAYLAKNEGSGATRMGREWFDEVATRQGGYAGSWACSVEGPNGQAFFDAQVLAAAEQYSVVLDCGCGDGSFTVQVAEKAQRVIAVDFSSKMIDNAIRRAERCNLKNVTFLVSHARTPGLLPPGQIDLAYSRRGPHILMTVPEFVRPGGRLMAIHPEDVSPQYYVEHIAAAGLECVQSEQFFDRFHFPTLEDLAEFLSRRPGQPDLRQPMHRSLLLEEARKYYNPSGDFVVPVTYLVWIARRPD